MSKIPSFDGGHHTAARRYHEWRKDFDIITKLNHLSKTEAAMLIYTQVTGRAKQLIEFLNITELSDEKCLDYIFDIYDAAFEKLRHERLDETQKEWEGAHRRMGQSMQEWVMYARKLRMEFEEQDKSGKISDEAMCSKILRGSGLTQVQRAQVFFNCGGVYDLERLGNIPRVTWKAA